MGIKSGCKLHPTCCLCALLRDAAMEGGAMEGGATKGGASEERVGRKRGDLLHET